MIEMRTSKWRVGAVAIVVLAMSALGATGAGAQAATPSPSGQAHLPASTSLSAYDRAPFENAVFIPPKILCDGPSACVVESNGTIGSVNLSIFTPGLMGAQLMPTGAPEFAVFDAQGKVVQKLYTFSCGRESWQSGTLFRCYNTVANWSATIPAGGEIGLTKERGSFVLTFDPSPGNRWVVGHSFAAKGIPMTTVWDTLAPAN